MREMKSMKEGLHDTRECIRALRDGKVELS